MNKLRLRASEPCSKSYNQLLSGPIKTCSSQPKPLKNPRRNWQLGSPNVRKRTVRVKSARLRDGAVGSEPHVPLVSPLCESSVIRLVLSPYPTGNWERTHEQAVAVIYSGVGCGITVPLRLVTHNKVMEGVSGQRKPSTYQSDEISDVEKEWTDWLWMSSLRVTRDPGYVCVGGVGGSIFIRRHFSSAHKLNCAP